MMGEMELFEEAESGAGGDNPVFVGIDDRGTGMRNDVGIRSRNVVVVGRASHRSDCAVYEVGAAFGHLVASGIYRLRINFHDKNIYNNI